MPLRAVMKTARLTLRPLTGSDVTQVVAGIGDYEVSRWLTTAPHPYKPEDYRSFLGSIHPCRVWAIDDGAGCCGTIGLDSSFGYWLARRVWGRGYATEAGCAVLTALFAGGGTGIVRSGHFAGNESSRNVLTKLGFRPDGFRLAACHARGDDALLLHSMVLTRDDFRTDGGCSARPARR